MSDVAAALFRRVIPGLVDRRSESEGLRGLLAGRDYTIDSLSAEVIKFGSIDSDVLLSHILSDYSRFALASLESHSASSMRYFSPKAAAWPLVKLYYSAFYAGHAILRALGLGIVRIDEQLPSLITQMGRIYVDPDFTFTKGTYEYEVGDFGRAQMSLILRRLDDGAAIHGAFWDHFRKFIEGVGASVVTNQEPASAQVLARIDEFTRLLHSSGAHSSGRLSEFRNAINYRHEHGAWFPFIGQAGRRESSRISTLGNNASIRLDLKVRDQPILAFRHAAHFLASVNFDLAELIVARSASRQHEFGQHWSRLKRDASK